MQQHEISGVILAGGRGSRLGGKDKGLVDICGQSMISLVLRRFAPQVNSLVINANRNQALYRELGYPVISDVADEFAGPLAGIAAALAGCATRYLATVPCDAPFLPTNFVTRLAWELEKSQAHIAIAIGGGRPQPAFTLISISLQNSLIDFLAEGGRKISTWYRQQNHIEVDFGIDGAPFANVNSPADLVAAEEQLASN